MLHSCSDVLKLHALLGSMPMAHVWLDVGETSQACMTVPHAAAFPTAAARLETITPDL